MIFGTGTEHCDHIADMLETFGISAVSVHSKKTAQENKRAIIAFKAGTVRALVNNNKLTTGFDCPEVDLIAVLRHTMSPGLWVQILGRGTRPVYADGFDLTTKAGRLDAIEAGPKQDCLVLDFAGNTLRLGPINDPILPRKKGDKGTGGVAPVKTCPTDDDLGGCGAYNHCSARFCCDCGYEFPQGVNFYAQASSAAIMVGSEPEFEIMDVTKVIYTIHRKMDRPDSILATYYIGLAKRYKDWICLEHAGFAGKKAREWWIARTEDEEAPDTTEAALKQLYKLKSPVAIKVWVNKKYPEIVGYDFGEGYDK
jgi:DNA repair protein RadD